MPQSNPPQCIAAIRTARGAIVVSRRPGRLVDHYCIGVVECGTERGAWGLYTETPVNHPHAARLLAACGAADRDGQWKAVA